MGKCAVADPAIDRSRRRSQERGGFGYVEKPIEFVDPVIDLRTARFGKAIEVLPRSCQLGMFRAHNIARECQLVAPFAHHGAPAKQATVRLSAVLKVFTVH